MPVFAMNPGATIEFVLVVFWLSSALFYYRATYAPGQAVLRPIRLYGTHLSLAWGLWYLALFSDVFNEQEWWTQTVVHGIDDGLAIATVFYFLIVSATSVKLLEKLGVD